MRNQFSIKTAFGRKLRADPAIVGIGDCEQDLVGVVQLPQSQRLSLLWQYLPLAELVT